MQYLLLHAVRECSLLLYKEIAGHISKDKELKDDDKELNKKLLEEKEVHQELEEDEA
jgi:hypothetical protein